MDLYIASVPPPAGLVSCRGTRRGGSPTQLWRGEGNHEEQLLTLARGSLERKHLRSGAGLYNVTNGVRIQFSATLYIKGHLRACRLVGAINPVVERGVHALNVVAFRFV